MENVCDHLVEAIDHYWLSSLYTRVHLQPRVQQFTRDPKPVKSTQTLSVKPPVQQTECFLFLHV